MAAMSARDCAAIAERAASCRAAPATPNENAREAKKAIVDINVGVFMGAH